MKLSKYLLPMALTLSAASYAQTSQTFHFGEGQTSLNGSQSTPHSQAEPKAKSMSQHKTRHPHHTTRHAPVQDPYSRP